VPGFRTFQNMMKQRFPPLQAALCGRRAQAMRGSLPRCGPPLRKQPPVRSWQASEALLWANAECEIRLRFFDRRYSSAGPYRPDFVGPQPTEAELEAEIGAIFGDLAPEAVRHEDAACNKP